MTWLSQNWVWVLLVLGAVLYFGGAMRGHGHAGHGGGFAGLPGADGHHDHGSMGDGGAEGGATRASDVPQAAIDPVDGGAVRTNGALTSVYEGRIYYFSSKENRDRFESAPREYAHNAVGYPVRAASEPQDRPRRRGGC